MAGDTKVTSDGEMAQWVQPLLFTSADSAAAGDLELADLAMQTLACCAGVGGSLVKEAFRGLYVWPTLECLSNSEDLGLRARAMAAVSGLMRVGLLEGEEQRAVWRDKALKWLAAAGGFGVGPAAAVAGAAEGSSSCKDVKPNSSSSKGSGGWIRYWLGLEKQGPEDPAVAAAVAAGLPPLAGSSHEDIKVACVQVLKVLSQEEGLAGLQVGHLWLATLLSMLAPRVKDYASVTQIVPAEVIAAQHQQQQQLQLEEQQQGAGEGERGGAEEEEPDTVGLNQYLGKGVKGVKGGRCRVRCLEFLLEEVQVQQQNAGQWMDKEENGQWRDRGRKWGNG
jgi:hypothetical protein